MEGIFHSDHFGVMQLHCAFHQLESMVMTIFHNFIHIFNGKGGRFIQQNMFIHQATSLITTTAQAIDQQYASLTCSLQD